MEERDLTKTTLQKVRVEEIDILKAFGIIRFNKRFGIKSALICTIRRKKRKADRPAGYDKPEQTQKAVQPVFALLRAFRFYIQFPTPPLNIWVPSG